MKPLFYLIFQRIIHFLCQDALQGFHWETDQATLHPFEVYYHTSGPENSIKEEYVSFCVISD
jgi:hypothetical protein